MLLQILNGNFENLPKIKTLAVPPSIVIRTSFEFFFNTINGPFRENVRR